MRSLVFAALLAAPTLAHAELSRPTQGVYLNLGAGLGAGDRPFRPGIGWNVGVGGLLGRYDDAFAIGRHFGIGLLIQQDVQLHALHQELRTAPMLELRRGIDLLVIGVRLGVLGGPLLHTQLGAEPAATRLDGGTFRIAGAALYRFTRSWSVVARLEAGVDVGSDIAPSLAFTLGLEWSIPTAHQ